MNHLLALLTDNVRNAAQKCGAISASVYVPTPWNDTVPGLLVHVGEGEALPELAGIDAASAFAGRARTAIYEATERERIDRAMIPSEAAYSWLLPIPMLAAHWRATEPSRDHEPITSQRRLADRSGGAPIVGWLGLRFVDDIARPAVGGWRGLLELASALASTYVCFHGILNDPVTGLPGRAELNATVRAELEHAQTSGRPFSLLFVKIEELDRVNERYGRHAGDAVMRECLQVLHSVIRSSDIVMRYGGAVLAMPLRDVNANGALIVGEKIQRGLVGRRFLAEAIGLPCAVAAATCEPGEAKTIQAIDLLRRAHQALSAARHERGAQVVLWRPDGPAAVTELQDPLLGVFTGQADRDYRNMRLLWDVLQALSSAERGQLAEVAVGRIFSLFAATRAALLAPDAGGGLRLVAGRQRMPEAIGAAALIAEDLSPVESGLCDRAFRSGEPQYAAAEAARGSFAIPLKTDRRVLGTLYLQSRFGSLLDESDLPVLCGVASHLALALDRERLADEEHQRERREQKALKSELDRLRTVVPQGKFVFRSAPMVQLLDATRRVAATDATVLVTGESGTGKEVLAHALHTLSRRHAKPLVIVDCGAIPASLMDSELFGRERGAYTGAERRAAGRLAQADGGTIFLDEIGELPLEVQAKLLRFVQEKTITMIGATQPQRVDVRIVAATNRSLEDEVRAGRFREDLFHRLNVIRLRIPPLREREGDVMLLAQHFLEASAVQFEKPVRGFEPEAEAQLNASTWPGNVRELQNAVLQAVVLSRGELLSVEELFGRDAVAVSPAVTPPSPIALAYPAATTIPSSVPRPAAPTRLPVTGSFDLLWQELETQLAAEVSAATSGAVSRPLGTWLAQDVVLAAHAWSAGVMSRAAQRLGLPESTFSRRLRQAQSDAPNRRQTDSWARVLTALETVVKSSDGVADLEQQIQDLLFQQVASSRVNGSRMAAVLGVSAPTLKRRLAEFEQRTQSLTA